MSGHRQHLATSPSVSQLAVVLSVLLPITLATESAMAQCQSDTDCDGDGVNNLQQACPADASLSATPHGGFIDARCFEPLLEFSVLPSAPCTVVAARRIHDEIDLHPLEAGTKPGKSSVDGVVFVGTYEVGEGIDYLVGVPPAIAKLRPSTSAEVRDGFRTGKLAGRPLFACIGSAKFNADGSLGKTTWVYGFRLAANYTYAILEAGSTAATATAYFRDGLGLIREVRRDKAGWVNGIAGTNGTLWDTSHWSTDAHVLADANIEETDLPSAVTTVVDGSCVSRFVNKTQEIEQNAIYKQPPWFADPLGPASDITNPVYQDWPGASSSKEYWASASGKATLAAMTPFGPKASVLQQANNSGPAIQGGPPGTNPPPPGPDPGPNPVLYGPKDQFLEAGQVAYVSVGSSTQNDTAPGMCKTHGPESEGAANWSGFASLCACELKTPVMMFRPIRCAAERYACAE